jgi:LL-diaminopimelate aminotransferase
VKSNIDSGAFNAVQETGNTAIESDQACVPRCRRFMPSARACWWRGLKRRGFRRAPKVRFIVVPGAEGDDVERVYVAFACKAGIVTTPAAGSASRRGVCAVCFDCSC